MVPPAFRLVKSYFLTVSINEGSINSKLRIVYCYMVQNSPNGGLLRVRICQVLGLSEDSFKNKLESFCLSYFDIIAVWVMTPWIIYQ